MVSNLILRGYGPNSHIITRGFGPITVTIQPPALVPSPSGGAIVIPEAIVVAEIMIKVKHLQPFVRHFQIKVKHIEILTRLPIKIKRVILNVKTSVSELILESFIKGLHLNIKTSGLELE